MSILSWSTLSLVIEGDSLAAVRVQGSLRGVRTRAAQRIDGLLSGTEDSRRALSESASGVGRILLTVPAEWCSLRPIALRREQWKTAQEEVKRSLGGLFPMAPTDALVGLIDRRGIGGTAGYLVVADRARVAPWLEAIARSTGREVDEVVAPHMSLMGLGFQNADRVEVVERLVSGALVAHHIERGEIAELCHAFDSSSQSPATQRRRLGRTAGESSGASDSQLGSAIETSELAVASALSARVAPGRYAPLLGRSARGPIPWAVPAAAAVLAIAALWGANTTIAARYDAARMRLESSYEAQREQLSAVDVNRAEAQRLVALLDAVNKSPVSRRRSVLGDLAAAHMALGSDGFLYRVEVDSGGVSLRGEVKRASDTLQRLENTPGFRSARNISTPVAVEERRLEMFDVRAERIGPEAATGGSR